MVSPSLLPSPADEVYSPGGEFPVGDWPTALMLNSHQYRSYNFLIFDPNLHAHSIFLPLWLGLSQQQILSTLLIQSVHAELWLYFLRRWKYPNRLSVFSIQAYFSFWDTPSNLMICEACRNSLICAMLTTCESFMLMVIASTYELTRYSSTVSLIWGSFCVRTGYHLGLMLYCTRLEVANFRKVN